MGLFYKMKTLKEFKLEIKQLGYKVKTKKMGIYTTYIYLEVLDKNKIYVAGSGANVYTSSHIEKHREVFNLLNENRNHIFDMEYNPPIKVLF